MGSLVDLLVIILVYGLLAYLIFWAMGYLGVQEPVRKVVTVVVVFIGVIYIIGSLTGNVPTIHLFPR